MVFNTALRARGKGSPPYILLLNYGDSCSALNTLPRLFSTIILESLRSYVTSMAAPPLLGAMTTLRDHERLSHLDVGFFELLVLDGDDVGELESLLSRDERCQIVHAPEKMRVDGRSELIDLADEDLERRQMFVRRVDEVSSMAASLGIPTVVHPGGVRKEPTDGAELSENLRASLSEMDGTLWLENMPRRYHVDGERRYCNLCTSPHELVDLLPHVDGVTLDISHAYLSVERGGNAAIASFFETLRGSIKHVHLSDAAHPDGEGLQLGDGDVDLSILPRMRSVPVLLEIWNGHLDDGAGFAEAVRRVRTSASWFKGCVP